MTSWKLLLLITLAVLVFVGLAGYGNFKETGEKLVHFPAANLLGALGLAVLNYGLRFCRWAYFLRVLKINVPFTVNILVFLSGLAMSITPGKAGELLKCYLLRDRTGAPVSASLPVVVMERLTDVVSVILLALLGLALLPLAVVWVLVSVLITSGVALLIVTSRRGGRLFDLPVLRRWRKEILASQEGLRRLADPRVMGVAVLLGVLAWFSEGVALWLILHGLDSGLSLLRALSIYAAATLVGAITTLPGGLVGTEGSMVALLQQSGIARGAASAGTLLVRLVTLWFAVAVGLVALVCLNKLRPVPAGASSGEDSDGPIFQAPI